MVKANYAVLYVFVSLASWFSAGCQPQAVKDSTQTQSWHIPENKCRVIHVFTALCDNDYQGIVKVPPAIGNGDDLNNNLYWGCGYGYRSWFQRSVKWKQIGITKGSGDSVVLERLIFKHCDSQVYLVMDAYRGRRMDSCLAHFFQSAAGIRTDSVYAKDSSKIYLCASGALLVFAGHNGLMDLDVPIYSGSKPRLDVMAICCFSHHYFYGRFQSLGVRPVLLTSSLMCPEAYSFHDALERWIRHENPSQIRRAAVNAYAMYQKISPAGAESIFYPLPDK